MEKANKVLAHPGPSLAYMGSPKAGNKVPMKPLKRTATARAEDASLIVVKWVIE